MKNPLKLLTPVLCTMLLAACGGGGDDSFDDRAGLAEPKIRLVHAMPLVGDVTLYRNGTAYEPSTTALAYKAATNYAEVPKARDLWSVRTDTTPAVEIGSVTFDADTGHKYTLIAIPDTNPETTLQMIDDPYDKGITSDNARVRVFNAALNAQNVDVYLTSPTADLATATPTFPAVGFKRAAPETGNDSLEVEGGAYLLRITTAGTKTVIFSSPVDLAKNADWLLLPIPASVTPNDVRVLVAKSDGGAPSIELTNQP